MIRKKAFLRVLLTFLLLCFFSFGCGAADESYADYDLEDTDTDVAPSSESEPAAASADVTPSTDTEAASATGTRDNTPVCLVPSADGTTVIGNDSVSIDISNVSQGYLMVTYTGTNPKVKLQMVGPNEIKYTFNLNGELQTYPLVGGSGDYNVTVYENMSGTKYSTCFSENFTAAIENEFLPYLYPSEYVKFTDQTEAIAVGQKLAEPCNSDIEVITNVYNYMIANIRYDKEKADTVESGYLPDVDDTLHTGKGICFDYAALMAAMLRSQQIPTRMEIGYAGDAYHAWISCYLEDKGWVNGIVEFTGDEWEMLDPTLASTRTESDLKEYIGDGSYYVVKLVY